MQHADSASDKKIDAEKDETRSQPFEIPCLAPKPCLSIGSVHTLQTCVSATGGERVPLQARQWRSKQLYTLLPNRLSFAAHDDEQQTMQEIKTRSELFFFSTDSQERYFPFCDDFGPVNLCTLVHFCRVLRARIMDKRLANRHLVYYFTNDTESASNAAFLLSAYLMLEQNFSIEEAVLPFTGIAGSPIVPFRDATFTSSTFPLTVRDCLGGLQRARGLGWFDVDNFDTEKYDDMDDPDGGDMHMMCPKFVAFRGPDDRPHVTGSEGGALHPKAYVERFRALGVTTVVRLNEAETYDKRAFEAAGFRHCDLFFTDCTTPSEALVRTFLRECDAAQGAVAVHCLAGLGRTGTMIGAWLMRSAGFTAREAIGWLRIVRPGSVIGPQQHFLVAMESRVKSNACTHQREEEEASRGEAEAGERRKSGGENGEEHVVVQVSEPSRSGFAWGTMAAARTMAGDVAAAVKERACAKRAR